MLDTDKGPHRRKYPISRQVPPGDVERFHIAVSATKSSRVRMRFDFTIDKDKVIKSDEFTLNIWMPSNLITNFVDGDEIFFDSADLKKKFSLSRSTHEEAKASWPFLEQPGRLPRAPYF